jgi:hypothetical protein
LFAEALVGRSSTQFALIPSAGLPPAEPGTSQHYRSLQEQFGSWRFLDLLQQAAEPGNAGKLYLVCFDALHPDELEYYFSKLLDVAPDGRKRLNLPGFASDRRPVVPPNVCITATVNTTEYAEHLAHSVLRHAGVIELGLPARCGAPRSMDGMLARQAAPAAPPAGYQRICLRAALRDSAAAQARLLAVLGPDFVARLHSSHELQRLTWRSGFALKQQNLHELTMYVANSFDELGRGLFDCHDPQRNARIAYDAQVVQRVLWRLRGAGDAELRRDLLRYLDWPALAEIQQAVA